MLNSLYIGNQDGGIINTITQVPQSDEPVVVIGLGGTGVDAITRLKTKLYRQIEPDNKDDVEDKGAEPQYGHIKFLGIDADDDWIAQSALNEAETLNIQSDHFNTIFSEKRLDALKARKEMQWMSIDYIARHLPKANDGAGGYRQFGRWLTIESANKIKTRLEAVIKQACTERNGGDLIVHIIAGISGGMGAGSFVDVCYIAREVLEDCGFDAALVFGYFVLPDVLISKDGIRNNPIKKASNQRNGMASLLEIEHLMNLKDSYEWFEQNYDAFKIRTQEQLVDMCHFVSATNMDNKPMANAYEYALNVIGDYILAFVSKEKVANGVKPITMKGNLTNIESDLTNMDPENGYGYSQNYHLIGSANAEIPTTEMATYLASKLFENLTISREMPEDHQIKEFVNYLNLSVGNFKRLEIEITTGTEWNQITKDLVSQYYDEIRDNANCDTLPHEMIFQTEDSLTKRKSKLTENRKSMGKRITQYRSEAGASSIPGKALNKLIEISEDSQKGPLYAYGMMNKTGFSIIDSLEARQKYCKEKKENAKNQENYFKHKEPSVRRQKYGKRRFVREFSTVLQNRYAWKAEGDLYEELEILMSDLITEFQSINEKYLKPLNKITEELIKTFAENSVYFELNKGDVCQDGFTQQLVPFSHIQPKLDAKINQLDSNAETKGLIQILTHHPDIWMQQEESELRAKISEYVLEKFNPILSDSLENFLREDLKMENAVSSDFVNAIQNRIIKKFVNQAAPIFWTKEPMVSDTTKTSHRSVLTVPSAANCVCQAAVQHKNGRQEIEVRQSLVNDRIYILRTISGVPMHGYLGLTNKEYLERYQNYNGFGLHLYEHNVDWKEILTFPFPYSYVPMYTKNAPELIALYQDAEDKEIIYHQNQKVYVKQFDEIDDGLLNTNNLQVNGKIDEVESKSRVEKLQNIINNPVGNVPINSKGNIEGDSLVKDNFLRFYGIQQLVKQEVEKYDRLNKVIEDIKKMVDNFKCLERLKTTFFDAIFVGLFVDDKFDISYEYTQNKMEKIAVLCEKGMPYCELTKYYQAFVSVATLDDAVVNDMEKKANEKFKLMNDEKMETRVGELLEKYDPKMLKRISSKFVGKSEQEEIDGFYASFVEYLENIAIQLTI